MSRTINRDRQMLVVDVCFTLMGIVAATGLVLNTFETQAAPAPAPTPWLTAAGIVSLMVIVGLIISKVASLDRRSSEEYTFQLISNGAVVSVMTTMVVAFAWSNDFLRSSWLGEPAIDQIIALLLGSWSVGYLTYRIRGVAA